MLGVGRNRLPVNLHLKMENVRLLDYADYHPLPIILIGDKEEKSIMIQNAHMRFSL